MRTRLLVVLAGLGAGACVSEPPGATAPRPPSLAVKTNAPSSFVVDVSRDTTAQNETPVAVNPLNSSNLLTGANDWNYNDGCAYNVSFDGGRSWSLTLPNGFIPGLTRFTNDPSVPGTRAYEAARDPHVPVGPDGTAHLPCQALNSTH